MRLDRFITLNIVRPFRRALGLRPSALDQALPVLMFHSISDDPEPGVHPYYRVCTSPQRFREQMQWLADNGCRGVTLKEGLKAKSEVGNRESEIKTQASSKNSAFSFQLSAFEPRPVVITFDDGFRDFYTHAFPVLQRHGFSATMYLPTAFIGSRSEIGNRKSETLPSPLSRAPSPATRHTFNGRECLTWAEVKELHRAGIEFGSHTVNHPRLEELTWPEIESEIRNSKSEIENRLGVPCPAFAYPYAFPQTRPDFVARFKDLLMAGGHETCVTTQIGRHRPGADSLQIKRLPVNSGDDDRLFQARLAGDYDWLGHFQSLSKKLHRRWNTLACFANHKDHIDPLVGAPITHLDE